MSFRPGAKKPAAGGDDAETELIGKPLTGGDYGEEAKLLKLMDKCGELKEQAQKALDQLAEGVEIEIS